jgi:hypothetical protein
LNFWLFRAARVLHPYRVQSDIVDLLRAAVAGEQIKHGEIERAVERSKCCAWHPGEPPPARPSATWPSVNREQREAVIGECGAQLVDLWEASPIRFHDGKSHADEVIPQLFPGNPLLCCGQSNHKFATRPLDEWRGRLSGLQLIVPSPMMAKMGVTQEGRKSEHTLSNTGPRRFLVIEQDAGTPDEQAAILLHLARRGPMILAVHSGNKSIHGWFFCEGREDEALRGFMHYAVTLGADRATWTRSQFVRMPGGKRGKTKPQSIYFFNPEIL